MSNLTQSEVILWRIWENGWKLNDIVWEYKIILENEEVLMDRTKTNPR